MNKKYITLAALILAIMVAFPASAQNNTTASLSTIISKAIQEIDQRVENLNSLISRLSEAKKISQAEKDSLKSLIQEQITSLSDLKDKIEADTNVTDAKSDYQLITKSYRIYALIYPQIRIIAAADRILMTASSMNQLVEKIKSRMSSMTGANATALQSTINNYAIKVGEASAQAQASIAQVRTLKPDQGDQAIFASNLAALKNARDKIKTAASALSDARKDLGNLVKNIKQLTPDVTQ